LRGRLLASLRAASGLRRMRMRCAAVVTSRSLAWMNAWRASCLRHGGGRCRAMGGRGGAWQPGGARVAVAAAGQRRAVAASTAAGTGPGSGTRRAEAGCAKCITCVAAGSSGHGLLQGVAEATYRAALWRARLRASWRAALGPRRMPRCSATAVTSRTLAWMPASCASRLRHGGGRCRAMGGRGGAWQPGGARVAVAAAGEGWGRGPAARGAGRGHPPGHVALQEVGGLRVGLLGGGAGAAIELGLREHLRDLVLDASLARVPPAARGGRGSCWARGAARANPSA
jgi:hypothetical protein